MAQRIGPTIWLAGALALGTLATASRGDDGAESPFRSATASSPAAPSPSTAPRPTGFSADDERVRHATFQNPAELRAGGENATRAAAAPRINRGEMMPLGGQSPDAAGDKGATRAGRHETSPSASSGTALFSMLGSLAIVLGLFFGLIWLLRRGMPKGTRLLSSEVVEVLGRAPLAGRQQMHVVRFGNKLLLVSLSPAGAETLSEITEPAEVDRLSGICQQSHANSATNAFRQVFRQFGDDRSFFRRGAASSRAADSPARKSSVPNMMEDDDV